ncbi:hypothetical protein Ddye_014739 [Dipteronia dyeriana]|uniref:DUF4220 domain-containing protein n=1 Tax=Dipteronia dyeriana TaxID=168575 RepID=A0AAE0CLF3_9ROSI|nr:hypothetical protein Ddye_014739 [Dipteronia dyeriana]
MYSNIDLHITFVLMVVAIITEIYAALVLLSSDRFAVWLSTHRRTSTMEALTYFPLNKTPRWSNNMPQYSLLCLNRKAKPLVSKIYPNYAINRDRWSQWNTKNIPEDLRKLVYHYFKQKAEEATTTGKVSFTALPTTPGGGQSPVEEFDYSIIIWHIATEVWYYTDKDYVPDRFREKCKSIKQISRYMMYLLVEHPSMLSVEILSQISIQDVSAEAQNSSIKIAGVRSKTEACDKLLRQFKDGAFLGSRAQYGETHRVVLENAGDLVLQMNFSRQVLVNFCQL